jgi:alkanesulfonate monooxygenase SsuD/methylene tetrahydromethanopterin reductase-like flavin-dependent oxidoreductase (luciferase family)
MDVGLLSLGDLITDPVTGVRMTTAERHRSLVEQAAVGESVGFTRFHLGEHHFCDYVLSAPPVVLAAIAERTTSMRLSNGVALGANLDPVRLAEDYATVDVLSGGRVEPCLGRGTFFPYVYDAFGQEESKAKERFAENVELLDLLWRNDRVTWSGNFRAPLNDVTVHPRPVQTPRPPIWIGAGVSPESIDLAARLGCWLMLPTVFGTPQMFRPAVELYRERWEHYGRDTADARLGCCTHAWVAPTSQQARGQWRARYEAYLAQVVSWQQDSMRQAGRDPFTFQFGDFDDLIATLAICGSPAEMVDRMGQIAEWLDIDTQILMFDMGGMPTPDVLEAIALAGTEVLPHIAPTPVGAPAS